jgi:hypothetical protein
MEHALQGADYHLVQICAKELVELVVEDVTVSHLALLVTKKSVLVMPARLPVVENPSALKNKNYTLIGIWTSHIDHKYEISTPLPCIHKYSFVTMVRIEPHVK